MVASARPQNGAGNTAPDVAEPYGGDRHSGASIPFGAEAVQRPLAVELLKVMEAHRARSSSSWCSAGQHLAVVRPILYGKRYCNGAHRYKLKKYLIFSKNKLFFFRTDSLIDFE